MGEKRVELLTDLLLGRLVLQGIAQLFLQFTPFFCERLAFLGPCQPEVDRHQYGEHQQGWQCRPVHDTANEEEEESGVLRVPHAAIQT